MLDRLKSIIRHKGPLPFERFMEEALYDPDGGFFGAGSLRSVKAGDFLTSPEVSPLFGETLAGLVRSELSHFDPPGTVVEVGAGSGSLMGPLLNALDIASVIWAVDRSPAARASLAEVLEPERVVESLSDVPAPFDGVILANELVDNLPMALAARVDGGWRERWVGIDGDGLGLVDTPVRPEVASWLERFAGEVPDGGVVEVQLQAADWLRQAIASLHSGAVVVIDYGDTAENLIPRRADGTIRTYRAHHLGPHPLDVPGATDITADVNFTALLAVAEESGASVELWRQDDFLASLGLRDRLSELRHHELELARAGDAMERLRVRTLRTEAETLLHPRGLGDFRVLLARV